MLKIIVENSTEKLTEQVQGSTQLLCWSRSHLFLPAPASAKKYSSGSTKLIVRRHLYDDGGEHLQIGCTQLKICLVQQGHWEMA